MPALTGILSMPPAVVSGALTTPQPVAGPGTRQSTMTFDLSLGGDYWDELNGKVIDKMAWKADGFKISDKTGTAAGQSNRFWFYEGLQIQSGQSINLDMYAYLSVNGGMGYGSDQLGLPVIMNEITLLYISNRSTASVLHVGGGSGSPWSSLLTGRGKIRPLYRAVAYNRQKPAWLATPTNRYLKLEALSGSCLLDIFVLGRYNG